MKTVAIENAFEFVRNGASIKQENGKTGIPISRIETIWNSTIDKDRFGYADITDEKLKAYERYLLKDGDILMTHINSPKHLGKCAIYTNEPVKLIHGMNLLCLRTNAEILFPKYALYYFNSGHFKAILPSISNQSVNQASFSAGNLKDIQIPLPPLPTQQKIAAILDAADVYRQKTKTLIEKYDQLAQSLFLEMFGDPVSNPKGWKVNLLGELTKDMKYGTNCKSGETITEGSIAIIRIPNIQPGFIDYRDLKYSVLPEDELKKVKLKKGDLLFVRSNGNPEYIGRCACFNSDKIIAAYASYLIRVRLLKTDIVSPLFVSFIFNYKSYRSRVLREARTTAGNYNLNTQGLKGFEIILPPITLQTQFAERVQLIESQKQQTQASLQKAEDLFNSLLQRAFKGELTGV